MTERRQVCLDVAQATGRLTSIVGAVFDRYGVVWAGASGSCPGVDGQYRIGSITKTFTAVLVMQARDAGLLRLDDPLGRHLGGIGYAEVTLRQLLSHTAGLQSEPVGPWWERSRGGDFEALVRANDGSGRVAPPDSYYHYSNLGYALLGEVVARVTQRPWRQLVQDVLLGPLGMGQTSFLPRPHAQPGWSVDHFTGVRSLEPLASTGAMAPAGQLWSTVGDLVTWGQFLAGSRPDLLDPSTLHEMTLPVTDDYGLGLAISANAGGLLIGHGGSMPGFMAGLFVDPGSGIGATVLTNATTGISTGQVLMDLIDGDFIDDVPDPWVPTVAVPDLLVDVPGVWFWGNSAHEARWHNEGLDLKPLSTFGGGRHDRFELHGDRLIGVSGYHRGEQLQLHRRPDGSLSHLECATFVYTRTPYDPGVEIPGGHPRR